jgi:hypothetical protein
MCTHVSKCKNDTCLPIETIPGIGGEGMKEMVEKVNSYVIYLIHGKILCKCHTVPYSSQK